MAFALGVNAAVALCGSVLNDYVTPLLGDTAGVKFAVSCGTLACMISLGCALRKFPLSTKNLVLGSAFNFPHISPSVDQKLTEKAVLDETIAKVRKMKGYAKPSISDLAEALNFPRAFWILQAGALLYHSTHASFHAIHSVFLRARWFVEILFLLQTGIKTVPSEQPK